MSDITTAWVTLIMLGLVLVAMVYQIINTILWERRWQRRLDRLKASLERFLDGDLTKSKYRGD